MSVDFYLFDVDHGQCAALCLPNGRWCIFDAGCTSAFSPIQWIAGQATPSAPVSYNALPARDHFRFLKGTISHLHGDHLADQQRLLECGPEFLRTVAFDAGYLDDCCETSTTESWCEVKEFASHFREMPVARSWPDYCGVEISEMSLPVAVARELGGAANSRVNNASVVTRINVYGWSILLCGDIEKEAWEAIIADQGSYGPSWRPFLNNIDILVAPHHGHRSGFSTNLLSLSKPAVVLVSVVSRDVNVDSRYSEPPVRGMRIGNADYSYISTRQKGHIKVEIRQSVANYGSATSYWTFGDTVVRGERR